VSGPTAAEDRRGGAEGRRGGAEGRRGGAARRPGRAGGRSLRRRGAPGRAGGAPERIGVGWALRAARAVARHPELWWTAGRQIRTLAAPGWWRRPPFLPVPPADYLRFRLQTAYGGSGDRAPDAADVVTYLRWCRAERTRRR
jgi:hypothetical protein